MVGKFDQFRVREATRLRHDKPARKAIKQAQSLLLRYPQHLKTPEQQVRLENLMAANQAGMTVYFRKAELKIRWTPRTAWSCRAAWKQRLRHTHERDIPPFIARIFMRQRSSSIQSPGRPGRSATRSDDFQRSHPSRHQRQCGPQVTTGYRDQSPATLPAFGSVKPAPRRATEEIVIISLPLGDKSITEKWPAADPDGCARFIRDLAQ